MPVYSYYDYLDIYYEEYYDEYWSLYYDILYNDTNSSYDGTFPPNPYEQPSYAHFICPLIYYLSVICTVLSICIIAFAIYKLYILHKRNKLTANKITIGLTMTCLTVHCVENIFNMLTLYTWYMDWKVADELHLVVILWDIFWCISKISLYIVFVWRYYSIFTALNEFSPTTGLRITKYIIFAVACIIQTTLIVMYILIYYQTTLQINVVESWEKRRRTYINLYWSFLVGDIILISLLGYLLTRSIFKLIVSIDARRTLVEIELPASQGLQHHDTDDIHGGRRTCTNHISSLDPSDTENNENDEPPVSAPNMNNAKSTNSTTATVLRGRTKKQKELIFTTTRLVLLYIVSLTSSVVYQFIWVLSVEFVHDGLRLFGYSWYIDTTVNMTCIYLAMWIAHPQYKLICHRICKCHQCVLCCIQKLIEYKAEQERKEWKRFEAVEIEEQEEQLEEEGKGTESTKSI